MCRLSEKAASNEEQERRIAASSAAIEAKWTSMVTTLQTYHNIEKRRLQGASGRPKRCPSVLGRAEHPLSPVYGGSGEVEAAQKNLEEKVRDAHNALPRSDRFCFLQLGLPRFESWVLSDEVGPVACRYTRLSTLKHP